MPPKKKEEKKEEEEPPPEDNSAAEEEERERQAAALAHALQEQELRDALPKSGTVSATRVGWKEQQPGARHHAISFRHPEHEERAWVLFGGDTPSTHANLCEFEAHSFRWSERLMTGELPIARYAHSWGLCDGYLWVWGGIGDRGFVAGLYAMSLATLHWVRVRYTGIPPARTSQACCVVDGQLVCFGGRGGDTACSAAVHVLDLRDLGRDVAGWEPAWRELAAAHPDDPPYVPDEQRAHAQAVARAGAAAARRAARPTPRYGAACAASGGRVYIFGGSDRVGAQGPSAALESGGVVFELDLDTTNNAGTVDSPLRWTAIRCGGDPPPPLVYGQAVVVMRGAMWCVGGYRSPQVHALPLAALADGASYWRILPPAAAPGHDGPPPGALSFTTGEAAQVLAPAAPDGGKGAAWADCRVSRVREDGLYDIRVLPTPGGEGRQRTGVRRCELRKRSARELPFPERSFCAAVAVQRRIVVFGGLQVSSNKRLDDTWLLRFKDHS